MTNAKHTPPDFYCAQVGVDQEATAWFWKDGGEQRGPFGSRDEAEADHRARNAADEVADPAPERMS